LKGSRSCSVGRYRDKTSSTAQFALREVRRGRYVLDPTLLATPL
jgi:hypothetical protein